MPGQKGQNKLCEYCARGRQGLWFYQDRGGRGGARNLLRMRERLTGAVVRVQGSHAETRREEEGGFLSTPTDPRLPPVQKHLCLRRRTSEIHFSDISIG